VDENNLISFWQISLGNLLTIATMLVGGIYFISQIKGQVNFLTDRMVSVEERVKDLVNILVEQGKQGERMLMLAERVQAQGKRLDENERRVNRFYEKTGKE